MSYDSVPGVHALLERACAMAIMRVRCSTIVLQHTKAESPPTKMLSYVQKMCASHAHESEGSDTDCIEQNECTCSLRRNQWLQNNVIWPGVLLYQRHLMYHVICISLCQQTRHNDVTRNVRRPDSGPSAQRRHYRCNICADLVCSVSAARTWPTWAAVILPLHTGLLSV